ncbi:MAG: LysM peptidoglycan-binding domain-containing protein [Thermodesulfobacteriota bacterium]
MDIMTRLRTVGKTAGFLVSVLGALLCCALAQQPAAQTTPQEAEETVQYSRSVYHTVERGDTLWDLSQKFYDDPSMWPGLWSQNPEIANPHWIYPGEVITLYSARGFLAAEEAIGPVETAAGPTPLVPLPPKAFSYPQIRQVGFIRKQVAQSVGVIVASDAKSVLISQGNAVYIRPQAGVSFSPGDRLTIFRTEGKVKDPYDSERRNLGIQHRILGELVLTEVFPEVLKGVVEESYRGIQLGDKLMPYRDVPPSPVTMVPGVTGVRGNIVSSENGNQVMGDGEIIFLDRGKQDGLAPGQVYIAYISRQPVDDTPIPPEDAAQVLVLLTEDETSSAIITRSLDVLGPGLKIWAQDMP